MTDIIDSDLTTTTGSDYEERVPPIVRTVAYWLTLLSPAVFAFVAKLGDIWGWPLSQRFDQTGILVAGTLTTIGGFLGVVYRPTANQVTDTPTATLAQTAAKPQPEDTVNLQTVQAEPDPVELTQLAPVPDDQSQPGRSLLS